jgi:hypothetical protein
MGSKKRLFYLITLAFWYICGLIFFNVYKVRYKNWLKTYCSGYDFAESPAFEEKSYPLLKNEEVIDLGWALSEENRVDPPPNSWYGAYDKQKKNKIRIGIFGCSYVQGIETGKAYDFPDLLQNNFKHGGYNNVEVINFGVGGYGIHQSYLLWDYLGKYYDLDCVIFNVFSWHTNRDSTFTFNNYYYPIHSRFIIEHNTLTKIPLVGDTRLKASRIYYRIIPPWRYFRYDSRTPNFLKPFLPATVERFNPFYNVSKASIKDEILSTYKHIFRDISQKAKHLIIIVNDDFSDFSDMAASPNAYIFDSKLMVSYMQQNKSIYQASGGHLSSIGNQIRADELYHLLTGQNRVLKLIKLSLSPLLDKAPNIHQKAVPLYEVQDIYFMIANHKISEFVSYRERSHDLWKSRTGKVDFKKENISSLLLVSKDLSDLKFLKLDFLLRDNSPVYLSFSLDNNHIQIPLGVVKTDSRIIGKIEKTLAHEGNTASSDNPYWNLEIGAEDYLSPGQIISHKPVKDVRLVIGDRIVAEATLNKSSMLNSITDYLSNAEIKTSYSFPYNRIAILKSAQGEYFNVNLLASNSGTFDFCIKNRQRETHYPFLHWQIITIPFDPNNKLKFLIRR